MNSNKKPHYNLEKKELSRLKKRRAVTEIISTMMLMGVTVSGATTLTYFMNDAFTNGSIGTATTLDSSSLNILLLAYDARDSSMLLTLPNVDNQYNGFLCGSGVGTSCSGVVNNIPANGGTEFIVFQIQNNNLESTFLKDLSLNGVRYFWDSATSSVQLDTTSALAGGKYPSDGMFSILPTGNTPIFQNENIEIQSGETVNVLVKLSSAELDIELNRGIRVLLNTGNIHSTEFILESGDAR
jgi:hypothetical protein